MIATTMSWTSVFAYYNPYEEALSAIEDNAAYYIKTDWGGVTYYLKTDGTLTSSKTLAGVFKFRKTPGGAFCPYGFRIDSGGIRFTNPHGPYDSELNYGRLNTTTQDRVDWDTQVLYLNTDGVYAIRSTNAEGGDEPGNWSYVADTYWTVNEGPLAEYNFWMVYMWQLEKKYNADEVKQLEQASISMQSWINTIQAEAGLVKNASQYTSNAKDPVEGSYEALLDGEYETFFHSTWHGGEYDPQADHYLQAELKEPTQKFQFYYKRRSQNNNNRPTTIVISASNDGKNFTDKQTINSGLPTEESVTDYISDVINLGAAYKYVRFTVTATNNGDKVGDHVFFTFSEFYMMPNTSAIANALAMLKANTPTYAVDLAQFNSIQQALAQMMGAVMVTYKLVEADGTVVSTKEVIQEPYSNVAVPEEFLGIDYYDYKVTGTIGNKDCEIIIKRTYKQGLVLALSDLRNDKAYTITCDRGKFLTKDGYLASTAHGSLKNAEPSTFAIINSGGNYYLYSVADGKFVTNTGALANIPPNGAKDAIIMDAQTVPYFLYRFNEDDAYLNTNGDDPYGYVINDWTTPDPGNRYYMIAVADFDPTSALATLGQIVEVYFDVVFNGEIIKTATTAAIIGGPIPDVPAELDNGLINLPQPLGTVTKANQHIRINATSRTPFEFTTDFNNPQWYNMTIRGNWFVFYDIINIYYYPRQDVSDMIKMTDEYQWAFGGNPYSVIVYNRACDFTSSLTYSPNNEVYIDDGIHRWDAFANEDGIILKVPGSNHSCINQYNGGGGPLFIWDDARALTDDGCTLRILPVPQISSYSLTVDEMGYATLYLPFAVAPDRTSGADIEAYTGKITKRDNCTYLALKELPSEVIPKNTPVVLKAQPGEYTFHKENDVAWTADNDLWGTYEELSSDVRSYTLDKPGSDPVGFYRNPSGVIKPFSAYVYYHNYNDVYAFCFNEDDAVGIEAIDNGQQTTDNEIYNLAGQRLSKMQKGIYIVKGKKVLR